MRGIRWGLAPDFSALALRRSEFQALEVLPDGLAKALAARDGRTAGHHEDEIAARRAAHFPHVAHVDQARAADAQHRLALRSEEHTSELQSLRHLVCRLLLEKKNVDVLPRTPGNNVYVGFMVWSNFTATKCRGLVSLNQVIKEIICLQPLK